MRFALFGGFVAALLFVALLVVQEAGRRLGRRHLAADPEGGRLGLTAVDSAIFALLGLLVAFSFNGAASRYEQRRSLIAQEANAIGTAYRRLDLVGDEARAALRGKFRQYLRARLDGYRALPDLEAAYVLLSRSEAVQDEIWSSSVAAAARAGGAAPMLLLPAINQMIDITTTRTVATQAHPPLTIFLMLGALALLSAFPAGYAMALRATRPTLHMVIFAATLAISIYVILDLEYPRLGLIRIEQADETLVKVLEQMDGRAPQ